MHYAQTRARPTQLRWLLPMVVLFAASGCAVTSDHPLSQLEDSESIPGYLLGVWDFVEIAGLDTEGSDGEVIFGPNADGSIKTVVADGTGTAERSASLATVGNSKILSLAPDEGENHWGFASLSFNEATQKLTIKFLGHAEVVRDIRLGLVAGEVYQFDGADLAHLKASPEQLRTYFGAHGDAFSDRIAVLKKRSS
jgi:hypothetical protein